MFRGLSALLFVFACLGLTKVYAQAPVANFTTNQSTGCSPVVVQFTDQSTGNPTSWSWDLGNGGTSTLQNPSASYITAGTYTVILTVTNSNGSSKDTNFITVVASPAVAFTADTTTTCGSKTVTFTNQTTGAVSYFWDFGDGSSSTATSPTHTYTTPGAYTVSLVASNSSGCTTTVTKNNFINIKPTPTIDFSAASTTSCTAPFTVSFTNNTSNGVSYTWNFGDGSSSTATNPTHTYTASGNYNVTLIAIGSNGCSDTLTKNSFITIGQVSANFTTGPACAGKLINFTNTTTPGPGNSRIWDFGGGATDTSLNPSYLYSTLGTYTVTLIEQYSGGCNDTITKTVTVSGNPVAQFASSDTVGCTVPFSANFINNTSGAVSYLWDFGDDSTSTVVNPIHTYTIPGYSLYTVTLTAISSAGCTDTLRRINYIKIGEPVASITTVPADGACQNESIQFIASVAAPFFATGYRWDFGDGSGIVNCATCSVQNHSYTNTGTYTVSVVTTTAAGCDDTVSTTVTISSKPTANFTGSPLTICPDAGVTFSNSSTGATSYFWNFGDGGTDSVNNPQHFFDDARTYDITLIASNNGCRDTLVRPAYVTVNLPLSNFTPTYACSSRLTYTFLDSSVSANTYFWDFGDGNTSTTAGTVTHTYSTSGTYNVTLVTYNSSTMCYDTLRKPVFATPISMPDFTVNDSTPCRGENIFLTRTGGSNLTYAWQVYNNNYSGANNAQQNTIAFTVFDPGIFNVKLIATDSNGCMDSLIKTNYIKAGGADVDFVVDDSTPCKLTPVLFTDNSTYGAFAPANRYWDFNDGIQTNTVNDTIYHTFNNGGAFQVKLVVTDANGCKDSVTKTNYLSVNSPKANFSASDTNICAGDTISFTNSSGGQSFTSYWDFGDGGTSTLITPDYSYAALGTYSVKLVITDTFGCKDSLTRSNYISVDKPTAAFTMSDTAGACPPLTVYMTNNTSGTNTYLWTFGNNNQSTNINPSTTYTFPGTYNVRLVATNSNGCKDTATKTVTVSGPTGTFAYAPTNGCNPLTVQFTANSSNTSTYIWDMNNGVTQTTSSGTFTYTYTQPGKYLPNVIFSDGASCQVPVEGVDTIVVDVLTADFSYTTAGNLCNNDTVFFNDTTISTLSTIVSRSWDFGDGSTSATQDPTHYYSLPGTYTVQLIITNANGCADTVTKTITINALPNVTVTASADSLCPGQPTGVTLTASGAPNYSWSPATGLSCTNCAAPNANPQLTTTYVVTGTDGNGCTDTASVTIGLKTKPTITVSNDTTICSSAFIQLSATGADTFAWAPVTGLSCSNCPNPNASPASTTTYTVIGTNISGCKDTADVTVTIIPSPVISAGSNKTICTGDSALLIATGTDSYVWSPATALSCTACDSTVASPVATTTYTVIGTATNGCKDTATVTVNVNSLPNVSAGPDQEICIGNSTTLQATGAVSYSWTPTATLSNSNTSNPVATPTTTTTYIVTGTNGNNCSDNDTVVVTVNPLPSVRAGTDKTICTGFSTQLVATGADTFVWSPVAGLSNPNIANPVASPSATTTYVVTGTDTNSCKNTDTVIVNVNPQPTVATNGNKSICPADSAQLQATGPTTYAWSPSAGLSCVSCDQPKASPTATTTYTVIGTDNNGCKDTATLTVTVNAPPVISAGNNVAICTGNSTSLQATPSGLSYTWSPATGLSCTNCANPTANPTSTTTYTVVGTNGNSCKDTATVTVTVNPLPNVGAGSDQSICLNDSAQLQATPSGLASYSWSPATGLSNAGISNPKASPAATTTYTVTGTDGNGCVNTDNIVVTIKPLPVVSAGTDKTICTFDTAQLQATGAISYTWTPPNSALSRYTIGNPKAYPLNTTQYVVTGTAANNCKSTDTVIVNVNPLPVVSLGNDTSICLRDSLQLTPGGAVNYTWSPTTGLSCSNCPAPFAKPSATTTYIVTGEDVNGCKDTADITITIEPLPTITATSNRDTLCTGDTTQLFATGGVSYRWTPALGLNNDTLQNPVATPTASIRYFVTGTGTNGCRDTASVQLFALPRPTVFAGPDVNYCIGGQDTLSASGAVDYTWSPGTNLSCTQCTNPIANPSATTIYTLTGVDTNGCINTDNVTVTVNPLPGINAGNDTTICDGDSVQLSAQGGISYIWSPATGLSCTACPAPFATTSSSATFTVMGTDVNGCSNSDDVTITAITKQGVTFAADDSICVGETVRLTASGGSEYAWATIGGSDNASTPDFTVSPSTTTQYRVIIKQGQCFVDTGFATVTVFNPPVIDAGPDLDIRGGDGIKLEPRSTNVAQYEWSPAQNISCTDCPNPVVNPFSTTTYYVKATSAFGCVAEDDVTIRVTCGPDQLFVANTFTPNADGVNDTFFPQGKGLTQVQRFSIYTRWGQLVYDVQNIPVNDPAYGWDGTYKFEQLKPDVFVYIIRAVCEGGEPLEIKGDISLIR